MAPSRDCVLIFFFWCTYLLNIVHQYQSIDRSKINSCNFEIMFANRIAIVTGGGSGIGRAVCKLLAKENASVIVADRNVKSAQETITSMNGGQHVAIEVDVAKLDSIKSMFESVNKTYGSDEVVTLLVNSAGITKDGWMIDMKPEDFDQVLDVSLKGTFYTTQIACKTMIDKKKNDGGSIVNFTSVSAKIGNMGQVNYVAAKAGVEGLTRTVAREMGKYNIRCNAVIPGFIDTPIVETVPEHIMQGMLLLTPLGRMGKPEEVADAIKFLLSKESSYITGAMLQISGGLFM
nr:(3R)-3-hydroxyacyl-CoA dehydrogenase-like [Dermatophagoides farinae]